MAKCSFMRKYFLLFLITISFQASLTAQPDVQQLLLPAPVSVVGGSGFYQINTDTKISVWPGNADAERVADFLAQKLNSTTGFTIPVIKSKSDIGGNQSISLLLIKDTALGAEGYKLEVNQQKIKISAHKPAGLFYGIQSLLQLVPKEVEGDKVVKNVEWLVPECTVTDKPRFGWRGLMFDVSRHFFTKQEVKNFIDEMVKYKYNLLHWHLTDDEGWRLEIKSLPKLTEVGAWRVPRTGYFGNNTPPSPDEPKTYGGFYTQDDIKEIIKYAKDRFVDILPEIDVPGHSLAAIASYPELSCTPDAVNYHVRGGEQIIDWSKGTPPYALIDNTLCPANEKVYVFLDKVMTEVAALFPFEYIHIGGDECSKNFWEKSDAVKALMKKEKLKNMEEVQSYFVHRLGKIVESKGKKFIGWNEILEGGLAPGAAVMSWQGMKGGIEAAKMGHEVVMSPTDFVYLDYMQGDSVIESRVYASLRLKKVYQFEPLPDGVDPKFIKGGQANLWTEQIYNERYRQYMLWPRAMAVAEAVWSPKEKRNWSDFSKRVEIQLPRLDESEIKYATSMFEPIFTVSQNKEGNLEVALSTEAENLDIHYSFDNSFPDQFYPKYGAPLTIPKDAVQLKVVSYRDGQQMGRILTMPVAELYKRLAKSTRQ